MSASNNKLEECDIEREGVRGTAFGNHLGDQAVSDLWTLKRDRGGPRDRCVQGRLSITSGDDEAPGPVEGPSETAAGRSSPGGMAHPRPGMEAHPRPVFHPPV